MIENQMTENPYAVGELRVLWSEGYWDGRVGVDPGVWLEGLTTAGRATYVEGWRAGAVDELIRA